MIEAATSRPSSVRRRALKARWGRLVVEERNVSTGTRASLSAPRRISVEPGSRMTDRGFALPAGVRCLPSTAARSLTGLDLPGPGPPARIGAAGTVAAGDPDGRRGPRPVVAGCEAGPAGRPIPGQRTVPTVEDPGRFINRELSWLDFAARLLDLVADDRLPLLERVKFLCIFSEGLDEFFQVRVAGLEDQVAAGLRTRSPDGMGPSEQLTAITERATELVARHSGYFLDRIGPALTAAGVVLSDWHTLDEQDRAHLGEVFERGIFPVLTPLAVGQGHPFPYISNLSLNLVVLVANPFTGEERMARVKVPSLLPRLVPLPDGRRFVLVEQVVAAHLEHLFPSMRIVEHQVFRVTRNADLSVDEDEADDLPAALELELHRRRFGQAVRLEVSAGISTDLLEMLVAEVDVPEESVYLFDVPLDLSGLRGLSELDRPDLSAEPWTPVTPTSFSGGADLFGVLARHDVLVHHPYESFSGSVEAFVAAAAEDPGGPGHQADPLPDRGGQPGGGVAHPRLPGRQAGHRGGGAAGPVRRAGQHRLGPGPGGGRRPGHLRTGDPQDPRQDLPGGPRRGRRGPSVLPSRDRQLQRPHRPGLRGPGPVHVGPGHRGRRRRAVQPAVRVGGASDVPVPDGVPAVDEVGAARRHRHRAPGRCRRPDRPQDQRPDRPGADRRPLPGLPGRGVRGPGGPGAVLSAPGCARAVGRHPGPLHRGAVPRALPGVLLRGPGRPAGPGGGGLGRPDGAEPRPPGGGGGAHPPARPAASGGRNPRLGPPRPGQLVAARARRRLGSGGPRSPAPRPGRQPAGSVPNAGPRMAAVSP